MYRAIHGGERDIVSTILENHPDTIGLFLLIAQYVQRITLVEVFMERLAHPVEILMIDRLRLRREMDGSVRRSHRPCPEMDATEIQDLP